VASPGGCPLCLRPRVMRHDTVDATSDLSELRKYVFCDTLVWTEEEDGSYIVGGKDNRVVRLLCSTLLSSFSFHSGR
jgi:hypothetical protein